MSSIVNEAGNKFTWVIKDFSSLESENIISDEFVIGGYKWYRKNLFVNVILCPCIICLGGILHRFAYSFVHF